MRCALWPVSVEIQVTLHHLDAPPQCSDTAGSDVLSGSGGRSGSHDRAHMRDETVGVEFRQSRYPQRIDACPSKTLILELGACRVMVMNGPQAMSALSSFIPQQQTSVERVITARFSEPR